MILAGDIGGTNTRLALFEARAAEGNLTEWRPVVSERFRSSKFGKLEEAVQHFLEGDGKGREIIGASFGVAGPVKRGRCAATNLAWVVDSTELAAVLKLNTVGVVNDLVANAYGIACLDSTDVSVVHEGEHDAVGNGAVISAGTGLGEAGMYWDGARHHPFASEGGHADFAARNELEMDLLRYLSNGLEHVSYERVLSGPGIVNIYRFLRDTGRGTEPAWLAEKMRAEDPAACITQAALSAECPLCLATLDLFVRIFGAEAGNLVLSYMATGGIWLGGGIAAKIASHIRHTPHFMNGFTSKGRLRKLVSGIPVRVILNEQTALFGAARHALEQVENRNRTP